MTENEAIRRVKEFGLHHAIGDLPNSAFTVKAFEMAIAALEKQIPKKPIFDGLYVCPNCHTIMLQGAFEAKGKCCKECGQLLDWSETIWATSTPA